MVPDGRARRDAAAWLCREGLSRAECLDLGAVRRGEDPLEPSPGVRARLGPDPSGQRRARLAASRPDPLEERFGPAPDLASPLNTRPFRCFVFSIRYIKV